MKKEKQKGFTLVEVLLVIAIMSIIVTVSLSSWQSFSDSTNLGNTAKMIETKIKLAKSYSLSALNDVNYGVHLEVGSVTIFPADAAYVLNDPDNQVFALTDGVEIYDGVGNDIIFSRLTGITANPGNIGIRIINRPSKTKTITINSQGQTGTDTFGVSAVPAIVEGRDNIGNNINTRHIHFTLVWSIKEFDILRLNWTGTGVTSPLTKNITMSGYFNADKSSFDWQGTETVDNIAQTLRIHTLSLDSTTTLLCIIRDRMKNNESLIISFFDNETETERGIITYEEKADGTVIVTPNYPYVDDLMEAQ